MLWTLTLILEVCPSWISKILIIFQYLVNIKVHLCWAECPFLTAQHSLDSQGLLIRIYRSLRSIHLEWNQLDHLWSLMLIICRMDLYWLSRHHLDSCQLLSLMLKSRHLRKKRDSLLRIVYSQRKRRFVKRRRRKRVRIKVNRKDLSRLHFNLNFRKSSCQIWSRRRKKKRKDQYSPQ